MEGNAYVFYHPQYGGLRVVNNEEGLFFIEVNIVPGMSEASIMPKQAAEMGIPLSRLFGMTLENIL